MSMAGMATAKVHDNDGDGPVLAGRLTEKGRSCGWMRRDKRRKGSLMTAIYMCVAMRRSLRSHGFVRLGSHGPNVAVWLHRGVGKNNVLFSSIGGFES